MTAIEYVPKVFRGEALRTVGLAQEICRDYATQGYDLTLRQLYYQFVARDLFPDDRTWTQNPATKKWFRDPNGTKNAEPNYKWLGDIINDARLAGYLDWRYIVDRTREVRGGTGADTDPSNVIQYAADAYSVDKWLGQPYHVEVWIEKEALAGVLQRACPAYEVHYFSCRGYTSQSAAWGAARRLGRAIDDGKKIRIIHLGDHDPSGIDMTRDIEDRLRMFLAVDRYGEEPGQTAEDYAYAVGDDFEVERIALNMDQVRRYDPPPNPAKITDSRAKSYIRRFGTSSWELDALDPTTLGDLIGGAISRYRDDDLWTQQVEREEDEKRILVALNDHWDTVSEYVRRSWPDEVDGDG